MREALVEKAKKLITDGGFKVVWPHKCINIILLIWIFNVTFLHSFQVCSTFTSFFFTFKVGLAHCALEVMPTCVSWDKGRAAIYILRKKFGVNWSGQGLIREINRSR